MKFKHLRSVLFFVATLSYSLFATGQQNTVETYPQATENKDISHQLMLIGGGLKLCSSKSPEHCNNLIFNDTHAQVSQFYLARETLSKIAETPGYTKLAANTKLQLNSAFDYFYANPMKVDSPSAMKNAFAKVSQAFDGAALFNNLPNSVYYAILDYSQIASETDETIKFNASKDQASKAIIETFIKQAAGKKNHDGSLNLVFSTASARDHFAAIHYYQTILEQAAVSVLPNENVTVTWLPLDQSLATLVNTDLRCEDLAQLQASHQLYDRQRLYEAAYDAQLAVCQNPEKIREQLAQAHGLFINGGDQLRTLRSMDLDLGGGVTLGNFIAQNIKNDQLIVAGTSAGAAVMAGGIYKGRPIPMITGGTSEVALIRGAFALEPAPFGCEKDQNCPLGLLEDDLTYHPQGGLGLFTTGIVDTHFSERDRHGRVAMLAAFTKTRYGFGIDENSAMLVNVSSPNHTDIEVIGAGGVFIADMQNAIFKAQAGKHQIIGLSHYLKHGESVQFEHSTNMITFKTAKNSVIADVKTLVPISQQGEFRRQVAVNCGTQEFHRWTVNHVAWLVNPSDDTRFHRITAFDLEGCSYRNLLFGVEN
ncbi:cyanophycinase [Planctobacterium marinum]|uniref:cyanophycinase n=1 Tax=Planctobacterium marinum TaxID=1631968 RepID=UPI001E627C29|nr:cyanophycinase [Planctobacterium marinum]MCC2603974.1 cyanophycinase [Planctobacterium marinum]